MDSARLGRERLMESLASGDTHMHPFKNYRLKHNCFRTIHSKHNYTNIVLQLSDLEEDFLISRKIGCNGR